MLSVVKTASRKNGLRVLSYYWDGQQNDGLWMSPPDEPKPADRWSRIVTILDQLWARAEKQSQGAYDAR